MFHVDRTRRFMTKLQQYAMFLFYPVIVFEGTMFEYELGQLCSSKYVQYQCQGISRYDEPFVIDVVEKSSLKDFLNMLRVEHESMRAFLSRQTL